ncbi:uncharacterized protein LOC121371764 [Gigantopelta aegis]|uniref:uncharacterized protein LOC121371764 n=1 Tax=Gigantopelta aegis TaxID=1735272 RepID=UPI001B8888D9|nr:uncharacterized protein LOC121371764 [Gigantopelta aegis]
MARTHKNHLIVTAFLCGVVLACGVVYCVVLSEILKTVENYMKNSRYNGISATTFFYYLKYMWTTGLVYVFPALVGLIGSGLKSKGVLIGYMIVGILSLLIMGGVNIMHIIATIIGQSACEWSYYFNTPSSIELENCRTYVALQLKYSIALIVVNAIGWFVELTTIIMAGIYACCSSETTPGVIFQPVAATHHIEMSSVTIDTPTATVSTIS